MHLASWGYSWGCPYRQEYRPTEEKKESVGLIVSIPCRSWFAGFAVRILLLDPGIVLLHTISQGGIRFPTLHLLDVCVIAVAAGQVRSPGGQIMLLGLFSWDLPWD